MCGELGDAALNCVDRIITRQTNADIIRSMSDEELANIIDSELDRCPPNGDCEKMSKDCRACWLNCLQRTAGKKLLKYIKSC